MDPYVVCGLGILLAGLALLWLGIHEARPSRAAVYDPETHQRRQRSRAEWWLSLISSMLMGLGYAGIGLIALRYSPDLGGIPASVPLVDQVLWVLSPVSLVVGNLAFVGMKVLHTAGRKRTRRELAGEP